MKTLQSRSLAVEPPLVDHSIRLEDRTADAPANVPPQRGLWRRFRTWIGF
jgi:hypothetical protein